MEVSRIHEGFIEFHPTAQPWGRPMLRFYMEENIFLGAIRTRRKALALRKMIDDLIAALPTPSPPDA